MGFSLFNITDGVDIIPLMSTDDSIVIDEWKPLNPSTDNSIWAQSPYIDGRQKVNNRRDYVIDTLTVTFNAAKQDINILDINKLYEMLNKAIAYWLDEESKSPVWIEAQGDCETNPRYAIISDWRLPETADQYHPPFGGDSVSSTDELALDIEHLPWQSISPKDYYDCLIADSQEYGMTGILDKCTGGWGDIATFEDWLPLGNHYKPYTQNIIEWLYYDSAGGVYVPLPATPCLIFPIGAIVNDAIVLGATEPYFNVVFEGDPGMAGAPGAWTYDVQLWIGGGWVTVLHQWFGAAP